TDLRVLLGEGRHRANALEADPAALAPPNPHRSASPWRVDHLDHHSAVTSRNDTATRATGHRVAGLHLERQATSPVLRDREQMEAGEVEEKIASVASVAAVKRVRAYATMVGHRRGPWCEQRLESAHHRG